MRSLDYKMNRNARLRRSVSCTTPCGVEDEKSANNATEGAAPVPGVTYRQFGAGDDLMSRRRAMSLGGQRVRERKWWLQTCLLKEFL